MLDKPGNAIRLTTGAQSAVKSKVRTQFNALVTKLEAERKRLAAWHDAMPKVRARADAQLKPLGERFRQCRRELIILFDAAHGNKQIKKKEREKLSDLICNLSMDWLDGGADEVLEEIYTRHSGEADLAEDPDFLALSDMIDQMVNDAFDDDAEPPGVHDEDEEPGAPPKKNAKGTRKATAQATRQAEEETRLTQTLREIFRKLASALHPDRETDPAERERKTVLMQRANAAYAANDLLGLLELQLEVDQIDAGKLDTLGDDRIKQYNKVLTRQVNEVRREIDQFEHWLMYEMHVSARGRVTPALMEKSLTQEIAELKRKVAETETDLREFADVKMIKELLKDYRMSDPMGYTDDDFF